MTFKSPNVTPTAKGPEAYPSAMQAPAALQQTIDASKNWFDNTQDPSIVANSIVDYHGASISQFVGSMRQRYSLGVVENVSHQLTLSGLNVDYINQQARETIRYTVFPESFSPKGKELYDFNFDGYCAWVHNWSKFDPPNIDNPAVDVILNGYGILTNFTMNDDLLKPFNPDQNPSPPASTQWPPQATIMVIVAFGATALRCQSIQDTTVNKIPVLSDPVAVGLNTFASTKASGGFIAGLVPPRKTIPANGSIPAHKDLPGYFVFNWGDQFNPDSWAYEGSQGTGPTFTFDGNFASTTLVKIIQFKTAVKSPLKVAGPNEFYTQFTNFPPLSPTGQNADDFLCAEFYSRSELRPVQRSWNYVARDGVILANDKPLYFGCDGGSPYSDVGAKVNFGLKFDLTPVSSPANAATFGKTSTLPLDFLPLTAAEHTVQVANAAAFASTASAFTAAASALSLAQFNLNQANVTIITPSRGSDVILAYAYAACTNPVTFNTIVTDIGFNNATDLVAYTAASLNFQISPGPSNTAAFFAAESKNSLVASLVVGDFLGLLADAAAFDYSTAYGKAYDAALASSGGTASSASSAGAAALASSLLSLNSTEAALISYASSHGNASSASTASSDLGILITAENAFIATLGSTTPQHILADNYKPIDQFNHRIITVTQAGGSVDYSFGPWSLG